MPNHKKPIAISTLDLRRNVPKVRNGLKRGECYVLLYRGHPIGEIVPVSKETEKMFFSTTSSEAKRIKRNVVRRRNKRLTNGNG
ncbi:hypothetical protein KKC44_00845 [Patescibacteria group bacterium]|nr:hypothetical protein [Patescibacteria group bacterium]MBU2259131.1 hypothetical protein [Patescibacteria group bacterium]